MSSDLNSSFFGRNELGAEEGVTIGNFKDLACGDGSRFGSLGSSQALPGRAPSSKRCYHYRRLKFLDSRDSGR
ncbi:unnamed protein product [Linum trigynum]|uniref:Uncharacterized protein n=1 Tax=Linum trigynum TaxID=586398 RepID=A0AAV2GBY1_9ROSI